MFRYFIRLAFDGTRFHGWQIQANALSVQQELTKAIRLFLNCNNQLSGCGRTDSGVHAKEFYAHFDHEAFLNQEEVSNLVYRLNCFLPDEIVIKEVFHVRPDAHARFSATSRTYNYVISRSKDPFSIGFSYRVYGNLDLDLMNRGAEYLMTCKDFSSFAKNHTQVKTNICELQFARWTEDNGKLTFAVTANRFLRNMVRAMVGTLLDLGKGSIDIRMLEEIILKRSRSSAGYSVPACGLFLTDVTYPSEIFL